MKKILGLIASQRKLANGEILVKEAANETGHLAPTNEGITKTCIAAGCGLYIHFYSPIPVFTLGAFFTVRTIW